MQNLSAGYFLLSHAPEDTALWFIFHHDETGTMAVDLTTQHPLISYRLFKGALDFEDIRPPSEQIVLQGGPEREEDALLILHPASASNTDSHPVNEDFAFTSYRLRLLPGKPPEISNTQNRPSKISLRPESDFLILLGFRGWNAEVLEQEIAAGEWRRFPASPEVIFGTSHAERRKKALALIN